MLDNLPRLYRHGLMLLGCALLTWIGEDVLPAVGPWLAAHPPLGPLAGALAAQILLVVTPLVRGYGVGQNLVGKALDGTGVRHDDAGAARGTLTVVVMMLALAVLGALLVLAVVRAPKAAAEPRPVEHVAVTAVRDCSGTLDVAFTLEQLHHRTWSVLHDDGAATVQLHHLGAAAGPGGHWETYRALPGGEGHLLVDVGGRPTWDAVRVLHGGYVSTQRPPVGCDA